MHGVISRASRAGAWAWGVLACPLWGAPATQERARPRQSRPAQTCWIPLSSVVAPYCTSRVHWEAALGSHGARPRAQEATHPQASPCFQGREPSSGSATGQCAGCWLGSPRSRPVSDL